MNGVSADEDRLRDLLSRSDSDAKTELETVLEARPPLRRVLANLALETAGTRPDPSILIKAGTAEHELPRLDGYNLTWLRPSASSWESTSTAPRSPSGRRP